MGPEDLTHGAAARIEKVREWLKPRAGVDAALKDCWAEPPSWVQRAAAARV